MAEAAVTLWLSGTGDAALLWGRHCAACGTDSFPPQDYGCVVCGAHGHTFEARSLPTEGTLLTFTAVRVHETEPVPFSLGDVELDCGPVVRAKLAQTVPPQIGAKVLGVIVTDGDAERFEFAPLGRAGK
ncbi:MAG: OB-fold domain-containing protein [Dehalococcoidia bacterium]|nr:OB-fold domain-containing protein [Dehalococcoidia bacterium]